MTLARKISPFESLALICEFTAPVFTSVISQLSWFRALRLMLMRCKFKISFVSTFIFEQTFSKNIFWLSSIASYSAIIFLPYAVSSEPLFFLLPSALAISGSSERLFSASRLSHAFLYEIPTYSAALVMLLVCSTAFKSSICLASTDTPLSKNSSKLTSAFMKIPQILSI